jgi:nucleotide-binding universal stress UspA family protein
MRRLVAAARVAARLAMSRVLIGTDGSARSADAVALGSVLASVLDAEPVLVHAHPYGPLAGQVAEDEYERHVHRVAGEVARHAQTLLESPEPPKLQLVADRSPAAALHRAAADDAPHAIVVGSSHRGAIGRVLPGGIAQRLLSGAPCPVAVAPAGYAARRERQLGPVGCGFDGSPQARRALRSAADLARRSGGPLRVIAVHRPVAFGHVPIAANRTHITANQQLKADLSDALEDAVAACGPAGAATAVLREGDPATVLAAESETLGLLVVGSRGYGPIGSVLVGSVASALVHTSACPVVIVPRGLAEPAAAVTPPPRRTQQPPEPPRATTPIERTPRSASSRAVRPPALDRIWLAYDGSDTARVATDLAYAIAAGRGARVTLVHVVPPPLPEDYPARLADPDTLEVLSRAAVQHWHGTLEVVGWHAPDGVTVEQRVVVGDVAGELVHALADDQADLVVAGTHGLGGLRRAIVGSVSQRLLEHAPCPVLLAPQAPPDQPVPKVVVGVDESESSLAAVSMAQAVAAALSAYLVLVHVCDPRIPFADGEPYDGVREAIRDHGQQLLHDARARITAPLEAIVEDLREGLPRAQLIEACAEHRPTVAVVGARGAGGFRGLLLGSTARDLVNHAGCPVLVVRE